MFKIASLVENLTNCTSSFTGTSEIENSNQEIIFYANEGYEFINDGTWNRQTFSGSNNDFVIEVPKNSTEFKTSINVGASTIKVTLNLQAEPKQVEKIPYLENLENCTSNFTGLTEIEKKDTIPMTIQANENYIFNENGYYILYTDSGQEIEKHILTEKGSNKIEFNLEITNQTKKVSIYMVAEKEKDTTNVSTNIYLTNENELNELSLKRFNTSSQAPIDNYSEYITNLFKIPFDVSNNIGNSSNIIIANINTNVQSTKIINSLLKVDLGSIEIKGINNNKLDYYNINPYIYLPFLEKQSLSIDDIMNQTIKVNYLINLYDGKCTINIYNNSNIILSVNKQLGEKIPFLKDNKTYSNNGDILINKLEKWYIIIDYNKPIETMFGYDVNFESILNNLHGYSEIKNVKLKSNASQNEQLEIKQQISQGVILP